MTAFMIFDREAIYAALFSLAAPAYQWSGPAKRRLKLFSDVPADQRPVLFQFEGPNERYEWQSNNAVPRVTLEAQWFIYTNARDEDIAGSTELNKIMNALHTALMPSGADMMTGRQTLGGLVYRARIQGSVFRDPGDLDGDGMLKVPIEIVVNA